MGKFLHSRVEETIVIAPVQLRGMIKDVSEPRMNHLEVEMYTYLLFRPHCGTLYWVKSLL